eukprot:365725-Chlamydomonas_euryale.AAC.24
MGSRHSSARRLKPSGSSPLQLPERHSLQDEDEHDSSRAPSVGVRCLPPLPSRREWLSALCSWGAPAAAGGGRTDAVAMLGPTRRLARWQQRRARTLRRIAFVARTTEDYAGSAEDCFATVRAAALLGYSSAHLIYTDGPPGETPPAGWGGPDVVTRGGRGSKRNATKPPLHNDCGLLVFASDGPALQAFICKLELEHWLCSRMIGRPGYSVSFLLSTATSSPSVRLGIQSTPAADNSGFARANVNTSKFVSLVDGYYVKDVMQSSHGNHAVCSESACRSTQRSNVAVLREVPERPQFRYKNSDNALLLHIH